MATTAHAILTSGMLTNRPTVRELEARAAEYLGVRHCVAVASCIAGLMLVLRGSRLSGDVVLPSFTFSATAHAVAWNGLRPVFADIRPESLRLDPEAAAGRPGCGPRPSWRPTPTARPATWRSSPRSPRATASGCSSTPPTPSARRRGQGAGRRGHPDPPLLRPAGPPPARLPLAGPGANGSLPVTDAAAAGALTLPLWTGMDDEQIDGVGVALARLQRRPATAS